MAEDGPKWPFDESGGAPHARPLVVDLENVLIAIVADGPAAERADQALRRIGFTGEQLRSYTSEQILEADEAFRSTRSLTGRVVGAVVDDSDSMARYVDYAREGAASLWVRVRDRDDAKRVIRLLADHEVRYIWFHGGSGVETIHIG